jgi:hypothetical protein
LKKPFFKFSVLQLEFEEAITEKMNWIGFLPWNP